MPIDIFPSIAHMLAVGRGGAILYLLENGLDGHRELVLDNCLHNKAYDPCLEDRRADYLYPLLRSDEAASYREEIIDALRIAEEGPDGDQILELVDLFARDGDPRAEAAARSRRARHCLDEADEPSTRTELPCVEGIGWLELKSMPMGDKLAFRWARTATDEEFARSVPDILAEKDSRRQACYLRAFLKRRFPGDPEALVDLFSRSGLRVARRVLDALGIVPHPSVRTLYERLIGCDEWARMALLLLRANYRDGDLSTIERMLSGARDLEDFHGLGAAAIDVLRENDVPGGGRLLLGLYENGPCSFCRGSAVELLHERDALPDWVVRECVYDYSEELRSLARQLEGALCG